MFYYLQKWDNFMRAVLQCAFFLSATYLGHIFHVNAHLYVLVAAEYSILYVYYSLFSQSPLHCSQFFTFINNPEMNVLDYRSLSTTWS